MHILDEKQVIDLKNHLNTLSDYRFDAINNGAIVNYFIHNVVENSCLEKGIGLSHEALEIMKYIMKFNYQNIYLIKRLEVHNQYVSLILHSLYDVLWNYASSSNVIESLQKDQFQYPKLITNYIDWLDKYALFKDIERNVCYQNKVVYDFIYDDKAPQKSIIDYLAGMTDSFIIQLFNELISFS